MSDVNVNINGRDNLTPVLRKARQEAIGLGQDVSKLDSISSKTRTEARQTVEEFNRNLSESKKKEIETRYNAQRDNLASRSDLSRSDKNMMSSKIDSEELEAITAIDKEQLVVLREIRRELADAEKIKRERASRGQEEDGEKSKSGYYGGLISNREKLRKLKMGAASESDAKAIQKQIEENERKIDGIDNKGGSGGRGGGFMGMGKNMMSGAGMGAIAATAAIAAAGYILKEGFNLDSEVYKLNALRVAGGGGQAGKDYISKYNTDFGNGQNIHSLGVDNGAFLQAQVALAKGSGRGNDLSRRTFENINVEKGMGVDNVAQFATMERQLKVQTETSDGIIELANILSNIKDSGIKKDDLVLLTEKLGIQQKLFSQQFQKRDTIDNDSTNRLIAAFSTVGLDKKGSRAGDFLSNLIGDAQGSGSGSNVDLLKNQAAREAFGGMSRRDLRRKVKQGDDPKYIMQLLTDIGKMTGEGSNHRESLYEALFPNLNSSDYDTLDKAIKSGNFKNVLAGKGNFSKNGPFNKKNVAEEAAFNTSGYDKGAAAMSNLAGEAGSGIINAVSTGFDGLTKLFTSGDAKVTVQNSSPKTPTIVKNTVKKP